MAEESLSGEARFDDAEDISDQGERVSHLVHDANFVLTPLDLRLCLEIFPNESAAEAIL